jgi:hypothetical protein
VTFGQIQDFVLPTPRSAPITFHGWFDGEDGTGTRYTNAEGGWVRPWDKVYTAPDTPIPLFALWPIEVNNAAGLRGIAFGLDRLYELTADIDLGGETAWVPLGSFAAPFTGTLDGKGRSIVNFTMTQDTADAHGLAGLFGRNAGTIINLNLGSPDTPSAVRINIAPARNMEVGALVGRNDGIITDVTVSALVTRPASPHTVVAGIAVGRNLGSIQRLTAVTRVQMPSDIFILFGDDRCPTTGARLGEDTACVVNLLDHPI